MANQHIGAKAQLSRYGGVNAGLASMFLGQSDMLQSALERIYGRDISRQQNLMGLTGQMFDKDLAMRTSIANAQRALQGKMFNENMAFNWKNLRAMTPSDFEMFLSMAVPVGAGLGLGALKKHWQNQAAKNTSDLWARESTRMYEDQFAQDYGDYMSQQGNPFGTFKRAFYQPQTFERKFFPNPYGG